MVTSIDPDLPVFEVRTLAQIAADAVATERFALWLFGVRPFDPATLGAVAVLFGLVAVAACLVPARRAAQVDPLIALRND